MSKDAEEEKSARAVTHGQTDRQTDRQTVRKILQRTVNI